MARKVKRFTLKDYAVAGGLAAVTFWLVLMNVNIFHKEEIARKASRDTQSQLASLQARQTTLQASINELSTLRGQEATVRETFGVARPGESEIVVVPPKVATSTPPVPLWKRLSGWMKFW